MIRRPPRSTLLPSTTLSRSVPGSAAPQPVRRSRQSPPNRLRRNTDRKSTRLNSSHPSIAYAVFCLKKKQQRYLGHDGCERLLPETRRDGLYGGQRTLYLSEAPYQALLFPTSSCSTMRSFFLLARGPLILPPSPTTARSS